MQRRAVGQKLFRSTMTYIPENRTLHYHRCENLIERGAAVSLMLVSCLASSSVLKMEATYSPETSVDIQWIA
jgi:hypothetical protein